MFNFLSYTQGVGQEKHRYKEEFIMNRQLYIETLKPYMKKAGIVLLLGAVIAGAGGWYKHTLSQESTPRRNAPM
jgi:hypothetical protein